MTAVMAAYAQHHSSALVAIAAAAPYWEPCSFCMPASQLLSVDGCQRCCVSPVAWLQMAGEPVVVAGRWEVGCRCAPDLPCTSSQAVLIK